MTGVGCHCRGCVSQGYYPSGPDCLYVGPEDYALAVGASEDDAALFREYCAEIGIETGVYPPTAQMWAGFCAARERPGDRWSRAND